MRMPLIIGLPGVGKSEVNELLSQKLGVPIISTDEEFRRYRAVPVNDNRPDNSIMKQFLSQVAHDFVSSGKMSEEAYQELIAKCGQNLNDPGRNYFYPSDVARSFGEDVFRTFEWVMNRELNDLGALDGKIVDISSSAALYPQNHEIFTKDKYAVIHLTAQDDVILDNLVEGFRRHQKTKVPVRGAYDAAARKAVEAANGDDSDLVIRPALKALADSHKWRVTHFNAMSQYQIQRRPDERFESVADKVFLTLDI